MTGDSLLSATAQAWTKQLQDDGFAMLTGFVPEATVNRMGQQLSEALAARDDPSVLRSQGHTFGSRNLLETWPEVVELLQEAGLQAWVRSVLGMEWGIVRVLFFDKPPDRTWSLPWHRDLTIAVERHDLPSELFSKRTMKAGVPHVEAPQRLLQQMLTLRVHLDPMMATNGPLLVIPGSHRSDSRLQPGAVELHAPPGGILAMRPLLLHSSRKSEPGNVTHRRIVHFELAPSQHLPDGYAWHHFRSLPPSHGSELGVTRS